LGFRREIFLGLWWVSELMVLEIGIETRFFEGRIGIKGAMA